MLLIRHGKTAGNLEKRYIGRTDEPLSAEGIASLGNVHYPQCNVVVSSPMQRCLQTAAHIFPSKKVHICDDFRECDFGDFEGKNYSELSADPRYQAWIDSGGFAPFPNGESPVEFRARCCEGFLHMTHLFADCDSIAFVVHGGTIMSILSQFVLPHRDYFDWMTDNTHGWICSYNGKNLIEPERL